MNAYLEEYSSDDAIRKYTSETAGHGISYLLEHDYGETYLAAISQYLKVPANVPLRLLEFGCGGGMNIITLLTLLERKGRPIEFAYGTDFSQRLVQAANDESRSLLTPELQKKLQFGVARNEQLVADLAAAVDQPAAQLKNSFHVILGVNTTRYGHRLGKEKQCAQNIADLLVPGGICIMIDMNRGFPVFRSKLPGAKPVPEAERYLPTLEEYAAPFAQAGLEVLKKENFCWIPHSASPALTTLCRFLAPVLNVVAKPFAMRSLVISRK